MGLAVRCVCSCANWVKIFGAKLTNYRHTVGTPPKGRCWNSLQRLFALRSFNRFPPTTSTNKFAPTHIRSLLDLLVHGELENRLVLQQDSGYADAGHTSTSIIVLKQRERPRKSCPAAKMKLCRSIVAAATLVFVQTGASAEDCTPCTNEPITRMKEKNLTCDDVPLQIASKCNKQNNWIMFKTCQRSCFEAGNGYKGDNCCPEGMAPTPTPTTAPSSIPTRTPTFVPTQMPVTPPVRPPVVPAKEDGSVHRNVGHVVHVVIDGLRSDALLPGRSSIFDHVRQHGACTLNARPDARSSQTLPNHIGMFSGINVADHGYRADSEPKGGLTLIDEATGKAIPFRNIFDLVAESGLGATAFYASKDKFDVFEKSWNITDYFNVKENDWHGQVAGRFIDAMTQREFAYSYVHLAAPDMNGHKYNGGLSRHYQFGVKESADHLWQILDLIHRSPVLRDDTAVIITADHGFSDKGNHADRSDPHVHDIPFCVYGPGVKPGGDLYALNPSVVENPGNDQADGPYWHNPLNVGRRPIRNVYAGVLAADLLGLHPGPGYGGFSDQYLAVGDLDSLTLVPPWPAKRETLPGSTAFPTFAPTEVPTAVPTSLPTGVPTAFSSSSPTPIGFCAGGPFGDGPRAQDCGAPNFERPKSCCPGYVCSGTGYSCMPDPNTLTAFPTSAPTQSPTVVPTEVPTRPPTRSPTTSPIVLVPTRKPVQYLGSEDIGAGWEGFRPPSEEGGPDEAADSTSQQASSGLSFGTLEIIILAASLGLLIAAVMFIYVGIQWRRKAKGHPAKFSFGGEDKDAKRGILNSTFTSDDFIDDDEDDGRASNYSCSDLWGSLQMDTSQ